MLIVKSHVRGLCVAFADQVGLPCVSLLGSQLAPEGSIVIGAGNRAQDSAIVKPMSSALINRMFHIQLNVSFQNWISWAYENNIHPMVIEYLELRPDHLWSAPQKTEGPLSTPRSWHMLSDALHEFGEDINVDTVGILANGSLTRAQSDNRR